MFDNGDYNNNNNNQDDAFDRDSEEEEQLLDEDLPFIMVEFDVFLDDSSVLTGRQFLERGSTNNRFGDVFPRVQVQEKEQWLQHCRAIHLQRRRLRCP